METHRQEDFEFGSRTLAQMTGARIVGGSHALLLVLGLFVMAQWAP